ncbi:MAG: GDP-mannose 4,6-dehydratase [Epsilonproteobacteria bacterium]|nr:GDP-mannose 4,6-dehydratase [Campylobacterota bacterium]
MKTVFITGITGQDGAYLSQLLLNKGYYVTGLIRKSEIINTKRLDYLGITSKIRFEKCDLLYIQEIISLIKKYHPIEIYNLAAQSSVGKSFHEPIETLNFNIISTANLLESIRVTDTNIKFYQASSSEMFGSVNTLPLKEDSIFHPVSPYGISKATSHWITINYRESFGLFTTSGILFNHESALRENHFIIKKIIRTALDIKNGKTDILEVGNIDIRRDFGYAPKYVEAMYLMMQHDTPDDYIISSGISLSIREIIYYIFERLELEKSRIVINKKYFRPNEIENIYGDSSKAKIQLGWEYEMSFFDVLEILIQEEEKVKKIY